MVMHAHARIVLVRQRMLTCVTCMGTRSARSCAELRSMRTTGTARETRRKVRGADKIFIKVPEEETPMSYCCSARLARWCYCLVVMVIAPIGALVVLSVLLSKLASLALHLAVLLSKLRSLRSLACTCIYTCVLTHTCGVHPFGMPTLTRTCLRMYAVCNPFGIAHLNAHACACAVSLKRAMRAMVFPFGEPH